MFKRIRDYFEKRKQIRESKEKQLFLDSLTKPHLYYHLINATPPDNWTVSLKSVINYDNVVIDIPEPHIINRFLQKGGVILWIGDEKLYHKVKHLIKNHIPYVILENKDTLQYNKRNIDYGFNE